MPHFPQGYRTDDLDLPPDSGITFVRPSRSEQQAVADESHAAYLCSHGLRWPTERPDVARRTDRSIVLH